MSKTTKYLVAVFVFMQISAIVADLELTILHNNDMHSRFEQTSKLSGICSKKDADAGNCYGGFARVAHIIRSARANAKDAPVLYLNAGDTSTGTAWYTVHRWNITAEFLNVLMPDAMVSWVRHRDIHLLTVGRYTYTSDQRFEAIHSPHTEEWTLRIRYPQRKDSGIYECQISTTPPIGHPVFLTVVEPVTEIMGGPDLYINKGSTINLTCLVRYAPEPPPTMLWSHNSHVINFDSPRGGISLVTEKGPTTTSRLLIQKAVQADTGVYTCTPSNANPVNVRVHILNGEHPAAMHHGNGTCLTSSVALLSISLALVARGCRT